MPEYRTRPSFPARTGGNGPYITSAIGIEETQGRARARRSSLFTRTVIWVTGLVCLAFLLGSLAQAWTNSQLMQQLSATQAQTQQAQTYHNSLAQQASHYQNPAVIEQEAREQLGYVRPGEHSVVVVGSKQTSTQTTAPIKKTAPPKNFWQAWWNIFFGS